MTDEQGRYRIEALRPGAYKLTFSLPGFGTLVRDCGSSGSDEPAVCLFASMGSS